MLDFLISPDANFEIEESEELLKKEKVLYVLSSESSYDLTALKKCAKKILLYFHLESRKIFFNSKVLEGYFHGNDLEEGILEN